MLNDAWTVVSEEKPCYQKLRASRCSCWCSGGGRALDADVLRKFSQQYKEYHNENKAVNTQPPTSSKYMLRLYPKTVERDAFLQAAQTHYEYK